MSEPSRLGTAVPFDLLLAGAWVAGALWLDAGGLARWLLVVPALGFWLGHIWGCALFPFERRPEDPPRSAMGWLERSALAFGLSVVAVVLPGLVLGLQGLFTLDRLRIAWSLLAGVGLLVALGQWYAIPRTWRWTPLRRRDPAAPPLGPWEWAIAVLLAVSLLGAAALAIHRPPQERYSELYLLSGGQADCYPDAVRNGTYVTSSRGCPATVANLTIGVRDLEGRPVDYRVHALWSVPDGAGGATPQSTLLDEDLHLGPLAPSYGPDHLPQAELSLVLDHLPPAPLARLDVLLYKDGSDLPSNALHLWVQTVS